MKTIIFYAVNLVDNKIIAMKKSYIPPLRELGNEFLNLLHQAPDDFWESGYKEIESYFDKKECVYSESFELNEKQKIDNVYYNYDLCSSGGLYTLLIMPENTKEEIKKAERYLKHTFDVVQLSRLKIDKWI
jgi:hypothetical protein